jgi:hypothetical protein
MRLLDPETLMRTLLLCGLLACVPALADEYQITVDGLGSNNEQVALVFHIDSVSGNLRFNPDTSFDFTNLSISNFTADINGTQVLAAQTAAGSWVNDGSTFTGFAIAGLLEGESDISRTVVDGAGRSAAPLDYLLSHGGVPMTFMNTDGVQWSQTGETVKDLGPVGVPEPGTAALAALAGLILLGFARRTAPRP